MTKLRSIAMVAVLGAALSASTARAEDGGWDTKYGMIFTLQNVFGNNSASTLGDLDGSVGLQYNLGPQAGLRLTLSLSRASQDTYVSEDTSTTGAISTTTRTFHAPADYTSKYGVGLGAAYMMRLTTSSIAPYAGAGAGISFGQEALAYTNDVNAPNVFEVDDMTRKLGLNAEGILGVEWRVHKSISLFAEYQLGLSLVSYESTNNKTVDTTATTTTTDTSTFSKTTFVNWGTELGQGGMIGLVAFF